MNDLSKPLLIRLDVEAFSSLALDTYRDKNEGFVEYLDRQSKPQLLEMCRLSHLRNFSKLDKGCLRDILVIQWGAQQMRHWYDELVQLSDVCMTENIYNRIHRFSIAHEGKRSWGERRYYLHFSLIQLSRDLRVVCVRNALPRHFGEVLCVDKIQGEKAMGTIPVDYVLPKGSSSLWLGFSSTRDEWYHKLAGH
jgi:hypothetical protein